jgi:hypothetical protein
MGRTGHLSSGPVFEWRRKGIEGEGDRGIEGARERKWAKGEGKSGRALGEHPPVEVGTV